MQENTQETNREESLPLIVIDAAGVIAEVLRCNEKGFAKSLERGELWHLHPETGRLLPLREGGVTFASLKRRTGWYEAVHAAAGAVPAGASAAGAGVAKIVSIEASPADPDSAGAAETAGRTGGQEGGFLEELESVVRRRKAEMPEGSYTTHLFSKGNDKIRKKLGEEAVELLLARERSEIIYEASDLLYHLLVLLADEDIAFSELEAELERRHAPAGE
jgi:phosphoribosyl-ATP pyrophosphohydrolase